MAPAVKGFPMRRLFVTVVGLALFTPITVAGDKTPGKLVLDLWDAAYLQDGRAGYVHTYTEAFERDGVKLLRTTIELRLKVKRFKDVIELGMDSGDVTTPEGKVVGVFMRQFLGNAKKLEIAGTVADGQLRLVLDGAKPLQPAPWNDGVIGLHRQQTILKDRNVKPGDKFNFPSFEPTINLVLSTQMEVKDYEDVYLPGTKQKLRLLRVESNPEKVEKVQLPPLVVWLNPDLEPVLSEVEIPGLGKFRMLRTTKSGAMAPGPVAQLTDIGLTQLVRLKQPIANPYTKTAAVYRIEVKGDADPAGAFAKDSRQQPKNIQGSAFELHVKATASPPAKAGAAPGAEFLQSSYFITSADAKVKDLARKAVGGETDPWRKALRVEKWVHDHMTSTNDVALATADHVAQTLQGDCTEYAMLTAAMCRAEGVPSRTAVGLIYADVRGQPSFAFHMWTEVWVGGDWRPIDATLGMGRVGATHLKICDQSWHNVADMTPLFPVVRVLGRVNIDVLSVE
jgi:transglutaminase-like putative cysteine protease